MAEIELRKPGPHGQLQRDGTHISKTSCEVVIPHVLLSCVEIFFIAKIWFLLS